MFAQADSMNGFRNGNMLRSSTLLYFTIGQPKGGGMFTITNCSFPGVRVTTLELHFLALLDSGPSFDNCGLVVGWLT